MMKINVPYIFVVRPYYIQSKCMRRLWGGFQKGRETLICGMYNEHVRGRSSTEGADPFAVSFICGKNRPIFGKYGQVGNKNIK
jgi:hypothetical protein